MRKISLLLVAALAMLLSCSRNDGAFVLKSGDDLTYYLEDSSSRVLGTAFGMFVQDVETVLGSNCTEAEEAALTVVTCDNEAFAADEDVAALKGRHEAFVIKVLDSGHLLVAGSDAHGAAFGLMELSSMLGVSPWEWWADSQPAPLAEFKLPAGFKTVQEPSVAYRGIFINDEDFGLIPWVSNNYEPASEPGVIGPKTNSRIFELLLRLKANLYWPAMHNVSKPFFLVDGNREVAAEYGIYIGSSHCEPMACNANGEWSVRGEGRYDFINNRDKVEDFWRERVEDVADQEIVYTLGMRGVHDGPMEGVNSSDYKGQRDALVEVLKTQRSLLQECVDSSLNTIPQVFIPYKEVLLAYNEGLDVPDDVTLMWCDDNYGYIRHFPTEEERLRAGGNGVYYHVSYWGRPHDYLWLGTFSPALLQQQMGYAYDRGIDRMWVLNVGDIKPAEYQIELFMDMAWDIDEVRAKGVRGHLEDFMVREFGPKAGPEAASIMMEHYRLAYIRKPEFLGNTRTEERDPAWRVVKDLPWSEAEINARLSDYDALSRKEAELASLVPSGRESTYFQLVQYPVQGTALMNVKLLKAQLARHGKADWSESDAAFDAIVALTERYNEGKWKGIMSYEPRGLAVYQRIPHDEAVVEMPAAAENVAVFDACDGKGEKQPCEGLGYAGKAAMVPAGGQLAFSFKSGLDSVKVVVAMVPTHPVSGGNLRFSVTLDGVEGPHTPYQTYDRSEEWKENVLNNRAVREFTLPLGKGKHHDLVFSSHDEGVILDRVTVCPAGK